jgi:hypothetical protein
LKVVCAFLILFIAGSCYAQVSTILLDNQVPALDSLSIQKAKRDSVNLYYAHVDSLSAKSAWRMYLNYAYESDKLHRIGIGFGGNLYKGVYYETNGGIGSFITDKYNDNKGNCSILPFMFSLASLIWIPNSERYAIDSKPFSPKLYKNIPLYLTNTMFYVPLTKEPYHVYDYSPKSMLNLSIFVKNDTDWFMFRKKQWMQFTPGAGIRLYFCPMQELSIAAGIQSNILTDFVGRPKTERNYFLRVGFLPGSF